MISERRIVLLCNNFAGYLESFHQVRVFTGPSVYFHQKAINIRRKHIHAADAVADTEWLEAVYATLTAWGMHRMGDTYTKLVDFDLFRTSVQRPIPLINEIEQYQLLDLQPDEIQGVLAILWKIIAGLEVGVGKAKVVSGTKTLHHLLPDLVPPIDRQYTLQFFYRNKNINRSDEALFKEIFPLFHRIGITNRLIINRSLQNALEMDTSATKIIDNAIVGFVRSDDKEEKVENSILPIVPMLEKQSRSVSPILHGTTAELIIWAVKQISANGRNSFSRLDIREVLEIDPARFNASFNPIFQAMRADQPGGAPKIAKKYRGVFQQIEHGLYRLSDYGRRLLKI